MRVVELAIRNRTGLHARPAREFVDIARRFQSEIRVYHGSKKANAKSILSILTLGVESGATVRIEAEGPDEELALCTLREAVAAGLGEGFAEEGAGGQ